MPESRRGLRCAAGRLRGRAGGGGAEDAGGGGEMEQGDVEDRGGVGGHTEALGRGWRGWLTRRAGGRGATGAREEEANEEMWA